MGCVERQLGFDSSEKLFGTRGIEENRGRHLGVTRNIRCRGLSNWEFEASRTYIMMVCIAAIQASAMIQVPQERGVVVVVFFIIHFYFSQFSKTRRLLLLTHA